MTGVNRWTTTALSTGFPLLALLIACTRPFYLGKYKVTEEQWQAVMADFPPGDSPPGAGFTDSPKNSVKTLSRMDCQQFLEKLNAKVGTHGGKFVLPSEAQWEYACRAGSTTRYCFGMEPSGSGISQQERILPTLSFLRLEVIPRKQS